MHLSPNHATHLKSPENPGLSNTKTHRKKGIFFGRSVGLKSAFGKKSLPVKHTYWEADVDWSARTLRVPPTKSKVLGEDPAAFVNCIDTSVICLVKLEDVNTTQESFRFGNSSSETYLNFPKCSIFSNIWSGPLRKVALGFRVPSTQIANWFLQHNGCTYTVQSSLFVDLEKMHSAVTGE